MTGVFINGIDFRMRECIKSLCVRCNIYKVFDICIHMHTCLYIQIDKHMHIHTGTQIHIYIYSAHLHFHMYTLTCRVESKNDFNQETV